MLSLSRITVLLGLALLLTACAQGTQNLRLNPDPPQSGPLLGGAQTLGLQVVDTRTDRDLGMLENLDGSVVRLMAAQNLAYVVQMAAAEALRGYDFEPTIWDSQRTPRLEIRIEALEHQVTAGVPYELETEIALAATGWVGSERHTVQTRTTLTNQRALPPSERVNAEAIEAVITRALGQIIDEDLARRLAGQR